MVLEKRRKICTNCYYVKDICEVKTCACHVDVVELEVGFDHKCIVDITRESFVLQVRKANFKFLV